MIDGDALSREEIVCFESVRSIFDDGQRRRSRNWALVLFSILACITFWERGICNRRLSSVLLTRPDRRMD